MWWWADDDEAPEWVDKLRELMGRDEWEMAASVATVMLPGKEGARERATLYGIRGVARSRMEEYDSAIADFRRALKLSPGDSLCEKYLRRALEKKQKKAGDND